jgi:elongation factor P--beta-lysine ligase
VRTWQKLKYNPHLFSRYFVKEYMMRAIRQFFWDKDYHELESPILSDMLPQERYLDVLETNIALADGRSKTAYLIPTTETFNKRILAAGLGNHFVMSKVFRALEDIGPNHSPEFTMLEWYTLGADYFGLMDEIESLVIYIKRYLEKKSKEVESDILKFGNLQTDISVGWYRFSVIEALEKFAGINYSDIDNLKLIFEYASSKNYPVRESDDWQSIFEMVFAQEVEPNFPQDKPVFLYNFPSILCPLVKPVKEDIRFSQKVELYMFGKEVANGYSELQDPKLLKANFDREQEARAKMGRSPIEYDSEIIKALEEGLAEVGGVGLGIDRLVMIFANAQSISDINYFPASEMFN